MPFGASLIMSDDLDHASVDIQFLLDASLLNNRSKVIKIPEGVAGECDKCGEDMPRLVDGICCRCRDKFKLP